MLSGGNHFFWLGASADADPATHEPSRVAPSRPSGECPLRVWGRWSPTATIKVRLCSGVTYEGLAHEFNWTGDKHPTSIVAVELPEFKA